MNCSKKHFYDYAFTPETGGCTTIIVTPGASTDGSMIVTHADDNKLADQSVVYVPARDWPKDSKRPVYATAIAVGAVPEFNAFSVPRIVDGERAPGYAHQGEEKKSIPLGYIPQVEHTYAYLDGSYGIMNEHGLMFGECTNAATFVKSKALAGKRLFYASELSCVALERCKTAREAISLMGQLIEEYGYYGWGETLPVVDNKEAWVMEMAPTKDGTGGLWAAQRVPDGHVWVGANQFRIRELIPGNPDQMWGKNLESTLEKDGWRFPVEKDKPIDWLASTSKGEDGIYLCLRRVWRVFDLIAPSLKLPAWVEDGKTRAYPFSVKPDKKVSVEDIMRIHRDHYEGTEFDMTKGVAAGPFGSPYRFRGGPAPANPDTPANTAAPENPDAPVGVEIVKPDDKPLTGAWERPIAVFFAGLVKICQNKPWLPAPLNSTLWLALSRSSESVFVPLAVGPLPASYENGDTRAYSKDSAWWAYNLVSDYADLKHSYMIQDITERASFHEAQGFELQKQLEQDFADLALKNPQRVARYRSEAFNAHAEEVRHDWGKLFEKLVAKYAQGYLNAPDKMAQNIGYTQEWLDVTDYANGPVSYEPPEKRKKQ